MRKDRSAPLAGEGCCLIAYRVAYSEAIKYYTDITPPEELERLEFQAASFHTGKRLSKITSYQKQRRELGDFFEDGE